MSVLYNYYMNLFFHSSTLMFTGDVLSFDIIINNNNNKI